jgi:hypothetical protein
MDADQTFQQRALRNVRSLFERFERDDEAHRKRQKYLVGLAILPVLLVLGLVAMIIPSKPADAEQQRAKCELDSWNSRNGELEQRLRKANPQITYRELQDQLKRDRPFVRAAAKIDCTPVPK